MSLMIKATFSGADGSQGYVEGLEVDLFVVRNQIVRPYGGGRTPYGSVEAFLKNWTNVKVIPGTSVTT